MVLADLFQKRQDTFRQECLGYLRYVLNDHLVVVLFVLAGFVMLEYQRLLAYFPNDTTWVVVCLVVINLWLGIVGDVATHIVTADQYFLLVQEEELIVYVTKMRQRMVIIWGMIALLGQALLLPCYLKLGLRTWQIVFLGLIFLVCKSLYLWQKTADVVRRGQLNWEAVISREERRQSRIRRFYSLFTQVKGLQVKAHRRVYFDRLLPKQDTPVWSFLYRRAFFRGKDYVGMTFRLVILAGLVLVFVRESWLAIGLSMGIMYLFWLQLLSLTSHFTYHWLSRVYPQTVEDEIKGLVTILRQVGWTVTLILSGVGLLVCDDKIWILGIIGMGILLNVLLLPQRVTRLIDRRY